MRRLPRLAALVGIVGTGVLASTACATAPRSDRLKGHMIRRAPDTEVKAQNEPIPGDSFEAVISKIRHLAATARPAGTKQSGPTIESTDPRLAAALATLQIMPTPAAHRHVAAEYVRLRLLDVAYDHYRRAIVLDREDGAAYDGLARIWRDWGLAHLGLGDARRAVYFAPWSAEAHNTLGTILQALGQRASARAAYEQALALDPGAAYAVNNLCYVSFVEGKTSRAIELCKRASALDPSLAAARHNLALVYAADNRVDLAERELVAANRKTIAYYNLGVIGLARRDYRSALAAFETACDAEPATPAACHRAAQLRANTQTPRVSGGTH
ncbi:MAG TPA: tetratricopeptide repeat protein [Vicinamibacterales bacterium]|nr:tetratricopeptide repeat protein [Vicinamibacterales bacterium]